MDHRHTVSCAATGREHRARVAWQGFIAFARHIRDESRALRQEARLLRGRTAAIRAGIAAGWPMRS
jgi:hypothetical protein